MIVSEITGHDVTFIYRSLGYARGLQYQTEWATRKGIALQHGGEQSSLVVNL